MEGLQARFLNSKVFGCVAVLVVVLVDLWLDLLPAIQKLVPEDAVAPSRFIERYSLPEVSDVSEITWRTADPAAGSQRIV